MGDDIWREQYVPGEVKAEWNRQRAAEVDLLAREAAVRAILRGQRPQDATLRDPWGAAGKDRFARDLEGLICTAREHGLSDEEILAKVLAAADALGEGLT